MTLKPLPLLLLLLSCTRETTEAPPRCAECTTAIVSTKAGCPTVSDSSTYELCEGDVRAWELKHTYVWVTGDGARHDVKTTCKKR